MGKLFMWAHPQVGDNRNHFTVLKWLISKTFSFWNALETGHIKVTAEVVNEDEELTAYLITAIGAGENPATWTGEITVNNDNEISIWYGEDENATNWKNLRNIILFQLLYGYSE